MTGTRSKLTGVDAFGPFDVDFDPFRMLSPTYDDGIFNEEKGYFPWMDHFRQDGIDIDGTDAVVPTWSSKISSLPDNVSVPSANHEELTKDVAVWGICRDFLNTRRTLGAAHRRTWIDVPISERNAYKGSVVGANKESSGGGLLNNAIVKVELKHGSSDPFTMGVFGDSVGIKHATLTGMVKFGDIGTEEFRLVSDENLDDVLTNLGAVAQADFNIPPDQLVDIANGNYVSFSITGVRYGRTYDGEAIGPDGESDDTDLINIGYEYSGLPDGQSPPNQFIIDEYFLPKPKLLQTPGINLELEGSVAITGAGSGSQNIEVRIYDKDGVVNPDDNLEIKAVFLNHPDGAYDDVLIPYSTNMSLFIDANGYVAGTNDHSGENPAQIYQYLVRPGLPNNAESGVINVTQ